MKKIESPLVRNADEITVLIAPLLPGIYHAATDPSRWPAAFDKIVRMLRGNRGMIFSHQATPGQRGIWVPHRLTETDFQPYVAHYHAFDVWMQRGFELGVFVPGNVVTGDDLLPRNEFLSSVFYREFLAPQDIHDVCAGILHDGSEPDIPIVHVAIYRPKTRPNFGPDEKALLAAVLPHLREATRIAFRIGALEQRHGLMQTAVEALSPPLLLSDAQGRVVFVNERAQRLLTAQDRLRLVDERLVVSGKLQEKLDTLLREDQPQESMLGLPGRSGAGNWWLIRVPMPGEPTAPPDARRPTTALMIHDSSATHSIDIQGFAKVHGLTPAEARIMQLLLEHAAVPPIAKALCVSDHTVRTHLRTIRAKTGARRQAELVRMLMSWPRSLH